MKALLIGVRSTLLADAALMALCAGGVHLGRAPDNDEDMPYLVMSAPGGWGPQYYTTRAMQLERVALRFHAWSVNAEAAVDIMEAVERILRTTPPILADATALDAWKTADSLEIDPDPTDTGHDVWAAVMDYEFMVARNPLI